MSFSLLSTSQIENLQDQLRDKEKQLGGLKGRVKSLQTDTSNTDTALGTLEEALAEKVHTDKSPVHVSLRGHTERRSSLGQPQSEGYVTLITKMTWNEWK